MTITPVVFRRCLFYTETIRNCGTKTHAFTMKRLRKFMGEFQRGS